MKLNWWLITSSDCILNASKMEKNKIKRMKVEDRNPWSYSGWVMRCVYDAMWLAFILLLIVLRCIFPRLLQSLMGKSVEIKVKSFLAKGSFDVMIHSLQTKLFFLFASKLPQFCHSKWNLTAHTFIRSCTKLEIKVYHKLFTKVYSQLIFSKLQFFTSIHFPKFTYAIGRFFPYPVGWHWSKIYFT